MKIIIYGAYAIGTHLAKLLSRNNHDTILIDVVTRDKEALLVSSAAYRELVLLGDGCVEQLALPVCSLAP